MSDAERTDDDLYDTVIGYRGGNWIMSGQKQAMDSGSRKPVRTGRHAQRTLPAYVSTCFYNIAAYPHLKGDVSWRSRRRRWRNGAYEEAAQRLPGLRYVKWKFSAVPGGSPSPRFYICRSGDGPFYACVRRPRRHAKPTITPCMNAIAPRGIAMLTLDMPSVGFSSKWKLTVIPACSTSMCVGVRSLMSLADHTRVLVASVCFRLPPTPGASGLTLKRRVLKAVRLAVRRWSMRYLRSATTEHGAGDVSGCAGQPSG